MPATSLTRGSLRELARAMRTTRRFNRDLHRARRAVFRVGWFFGWMSQLIDRSDEKKNCACDNEKINQERNEVAVIPCDCSGLHCVCRSVERHRAILSGSQNDKFV